MRSEFVEHYPSLYLSYAAALIAWSAVWRFRPDWWPKSDAYRFKNSWTEVGLVFLAGIAVIIIGQLYIAGIRLPKEGIVGPVLESINQALIFSPMLALLAWRKHPLETAWIKRDAVPRRLGVGFGLALSALLVYTLARDGADPWWRVVPRTYSYANLGLALQVFLEDFTIAMLVVRISSAIGNAATVVLVALLFAAGHIPTMVQEGAALVEFVSLIGDAVLGVAVIAIAMRSRDIWWLWLVHFSMDMTQFERISGVGS